MPSIEDLLNKISDFKCVVDGKEVVFSGILQRENGDIILNARFPLAEYRKIGNDSDIVVLGEVAGGKATLLGCYIKSASWVMGKKRYFYLCDSKRNNCWCVLLFNTYGKKD